MGEVIRYVDTDVVGGLGDGSSWANAHPTLQDWETDNQADLDTANNWMHVYVRGAADDTGRLTIDGWTTSATDYILIEATSDSIGKHSGVWDTGKYIIDSNNVEATTVGILENYVRIQGIQVSDKHSSGTQHGIYTDGTNTLLKNILIKGVKTGTATGGAGICVYVTSGSKVITVENCIISGVINSTNSMEGMWVGGGSLTVNVYNTLISDCRTGMTSWATGSTINGYNTVVFNCNDDFSETDGGVITCDYCASDDANASTYTNGVDFTSEATDWGNIFTDYANADFRLKNYTGARCLIDKGASQTYGDPDIRGMARVTWDIGPFEAAPLSISASECVGSLGRLA